MTTTDNAQTWRDLLGDLTPEQINELEYCEREQIPPGLAEPHNLLNGARAMIRHNLAQAFCAGIEPPADAIDEPSPWEEWDEGDYRRVYTCWQREAAGITVAVLGYQHSDGRIDRTIYCTNNESEDLNASRAKIMSMLLDEAADKLDKPA